MCFYVYVFRRIRIIIVREITFLCPAPFPPLKGSQKKNLISKKYLIGLEVEAGVYKRLRFTVRRRFIIFSLPTKPASMSVST